MQGLERGADDLEGGHGKVSFPSDKLGVQAARPISTGQLNALQRLHLRPINLLVLEGPLGLASGYLILGWASRLYAFSGYPIRT